MDKKYIATQLARRMHSSEREAATWLEATLELLHEAAGSKGLEVSADIAGRTERVSVPGDAVEVDVPVLRSVTPATRLSIGEQIQLNHFPFRVGRECRTELSTGAFGAGERREASGQAVNDLYVRDMDEPLNVSRDHFQIEVKEGGVFEVVDRGSACGTRVNNQVIGGNNMGGRCILQYGDTIVVGTSKSAIRFEFLPGGK